MASQLVQLWPHLSQDRSYRLSHLNFLTHILLAFFDWNLGGSTCPIMSAFSSVLTNTIWETLVGDLGLPSRGHDPEVCVQSSVSPPPPSRVGASVARVAATNNPALLATL